MVPLVSTAISKPWACRASLRRSTPLSNMHSNAAGSFEADSLLAPAATPMPGPPLWLLAELTYRCPLHCAFCSNPVDYTRHDQELSTEQWCDVFT